MTNQPSPATPPKKKGLPVLAWVAIGCGAIVILTLVAFGALGFFAVRKGTEMVKEATGADSVSEFVEGFEKNPARAAAETAIRLNPELELVSSDDEAGTITFRNSRTGETATVDFEEIAQGRLSITTDEGDYSFDASDGVTVTGPEGTTRPARFRPGCRSTRAAATGAVCSAPPAARSSPGPPPGARATLRRT